jgi:preprotein translocase subunit SecF
MELFKVSSQYNFMGKRRIAVWISIILCVVAVIALFTNGIRFGLDFTGGMQVELAFPQAADLQKIRTTLNENVTQDTVVQSYGRANDVLISLGAVQTEEQNAQARQDEAIRAQIAQLFPQASITRVEFVGPQLGKELAYNGALAVLVAMIGTMIYILLRFEYRFAVSAVVALVHDTLLILGIFALFRVEFDVNTLGAVLAVIGYSLNDTIVVFDRVRENFRKLRTQSAIEVVNKSINQTLSRTIITSISTLLVVVVLFFLGGAMIHNFALTLILGVVIGTYSSIYIASSVAIRMGLNRQDFLPPAKPEVDAAP